MTNKHAGAGEVNTREIILDILIEICEKGAYSHVVLRQSLRKYQYLDKRDRAFITRIVEGTLENKIYIDYVINQVSNIKVHKMKPLIRNLLRMSVYQVLMMDNVPAAAACNEAVKLATKRSFGQLRGFVNGVLRAIIRNIDTMKFPNASIDLVEHMHIMYSMPKWIIEQLVYHYGVEDASRIIKGVSKHDERICVRLNTAKASADDIVARLESENMTVERSQVYKDAAYISGVDFLEGSDTFNEGLISVQDLSSMLVSVIADPKEGDVCLDMCAAPGGKAIHLYELMAGKGKVIARDISDYKVGLIEENIDRTESFGVEAEVFDATQLDKEMLEKADIVVADLPCSGLGIMGKKSDIKYNMTEEKEKELVQLQRAMLDNAWQYVKPGGTLVYSTCTLNREENIDNMKYIEEKYPLKRVDISEYVPEGFCRGTAKDGYLQMLPGIDGADGFFICKFKKD
ncbi:MAG: 16S rRNA (cytosine(967)-C(5))-methyltransferase RsmB [Lachnospiraceae bacterium]|nr:16S rRNA (cytosine(967)-C(5))-methyltransferase RsmB [Lachnospiraceae bacterium]